MRAVVVAAGGVRVEDAPEVVLRERDRGVEILPAEGADEPFAVGADTLGSVRESCPGKTQRRIWRFVTVPVC